MSDITEQILIPVLRVVNPFDLRDHVRETLVWERSKTLADYFPLGMTEHLISVNGKPIEAEDMSVTYLDCTDSLVMCPIPLGGGFNGILRVVAMIAVAYFTAGAGNAWLVGAGSLTGATGIAATAIGIGALTAGGMLINTLMPAATPTARNNSHSGSIGDSTASSPSYGIDGAKNTSTEGIPVPICYGGFRMAGNVLDQYVENVGSTQILYMLLNAGEGPVSALDEIRINDRPITDYKNVQAQVAGGYNAQSPLPWFTQTIAPHSLNQRLVNGEYVTYQTSVSVDRLRFDFVFPQGLGGVDSVSGSRYAVEVPMRIEVLRSGTGNWINCGIRQSGSKTIYHYTVSAVSVPILDAYQEIVGFTTTPAYEVFTTISPTGSAGTGPTNYSVGYGYLIQSDKIFLFYSDTGEVGPQIGYVEHKPLFAPGVSVSENSTAAVRRSFFTPDGLTPGIYNIRVTRETAKSTSTYIADDVYLTDINEILLDNVAFVNTALVALRIQLDDQLSGVPTVTFKNSGILILAFDVASQTYVNRPSKNPAWITLDVLTNQRYGAAMSYSSFDLGKFKEWALFCEAHHLTFEGVIDTVMNVWDAISPILRCGRAQIVNVGTRFTVVIEGPAIPTMMFGVGNILEGSFKQNWLSVAERANEIEVTFYDRADNYKQRSVKVVDQQAIATGAPQRPAFITLPGIVDKDKAYREGFFQLNLNRYVLQTVEFSAPIEAIACTVGDLVYVQHDMPQWGIAGRTEIGSTTSTIILDRDALIETDKQYKLLLKHDALRRSTGTILSVVGDSLVVSGWNGQGRVTRIQTQGKDRAVLSTFDAGSGNYGVVVETDTYTTGAAIDLWDTDVIEERDVVATVGTSQSLVVMSPFSLAPSQYVNFMFGEVTKIKKPFRVKMINGNHDYKRHLTLVEYNASCYDFSGMTLPTPNYSSLSGLVTHVTIDGVTERLTVNGGSFITKVTVGFHSTQALFSSASVKVSVNGSGFYEIEASAKDSATLDAQNGDVVIFKIIARDGIGSTANEATAPTLSYNVIGTAYPPNNVIGFTVRVSAGALLLNWSANTDVDLLGYEIREGTSWDTGALIVTNYAGTSYPVSKNNAGVYNFMIRALDTGLRLSTTPAVASITLNPPSAVVGFDCVQNGSLIEFRWSPNPEPLIVGYEIREGASWQLALLVTQVAATNYSMSANSVIGYRTFWIKAIIEPGISSNLAMFSTTQVAIASDRNVIYTDDELSNNWVGSKYQLSLVDSALQLDAGASYGEYTFGISLPTKYRARNSIDSSFGAVILSTVSWADATWNWAAQQSSRAWAVSGDISTVGVKYSISKFIGLDAAYLEGFGLNGIASGERGTATSENVGVTYGAGRFLRGAVLNDFSRLSWDLSIPSLFNVTFWAIPQSIVGNQVYWVAKTAFGLTLTCGYSSANSEFYLEDSTGNRMSLPYSIVTGDRVLIAIIQTATTRRLYVGALNKTSSFVSAALTPLGAMTKIQLQQ